MREACTGEDGEREMGGVEEMKRGNTYERANGRTKKNRKVGGGKKRAKKKYNIRRQCCISATQENTDGA